MVVKDEELGGTITVAEENGAPLLRLAGEVDYAVVAAYEQKSPASRPVSVVDATAVTFLDCRALDFLIDRTRDVREAGGTPVLRHPPRIVRRLLHLAGAEEFFRTAA